MTGRTILSSASALVIMAAATTASTQVLPTCRVRVVKSAATEAVARSVVSQVEQWVDVPERGCRLVSSIDDADVLVELHGYRLTTTRDGTPGEEWRFIARRLSEPVRERATYRFAYVTWLDRRTTAHVAKELPTVLSDVCLGYLPKLSLARLAGSTRRGPVSPCGSLSGSWQGPCELTARRAEHDDTTIVCRPTPAGEGRAAEQGDEAER